MQSQPPSAVAQYTAQMAKTHPYPRDQFEHGAFLIDTEDRSEFADKMGKFSVLVDKNILLSNISNDTLMRYYQNDIILLTHLFSMALREEALQPVFQVLYYGWKHELALTRTKGGAERKHQAQIGTNYNPKESLLGYGSGLNFPQQNQQNSEEGNFFTKIFNRKKTQG